MTEPFLRSISFSVLSDEPDQHLLLSKNLTVFTASEWFVNDILDLSERKDQICTIFELCPVKKLSGIELLKSIDKGRLFPQ